MDVDDEESNISKDDTAIKDAIPVNNEGFKIPTLLCKPPTKKETKDNAGSLSFAEPIATQDTDAKRPQISFKPKSRVLPSNIYKPHRPPPPEFVKREIKSVAMELDQKSTTENGNESEKETPLKDDKNKNDQLKLKETHKPAKTVVEYVSPKWSCKYEKIEDALYSLEVLKEGKIINHIDIPEQEYLLFGRQTECDVTLEHPSISRYHAVLQYGAPEDKDNVEFQKDGSAGFYLYDLGSTHGTFLNKVRAPARKYYRVKVGHMVKFGGSSRVYILQGPADDEEEEAPETPTELRDRARKEREERKTKESLARKMMGDDSSSDDDDDDTTRKRKPTSHDDDEQKGISWGMLEDAIAENPSDSDEDDAKDKLTEKEILANLEHEKERFYVKDPHKALKHFYDQEGIELEFDCDEKRPGQWLARLELPVNSASGKPVFAEASVTGKRRDALNNCALEACRVLDRHGMFSQSERQRRKVKQWEKEDFYDSDEDTYWDRTGDLDLKRRMRKQRLGKVKAKNEEKAETYESLTAKIKKLEAEIENIEKQLERDKEATRTRAGSDDPLDEFMRNVRAGKTLDSVTRGKLRIRLLQARKEALQLRKLADAARPAHLPPLHSSSNPKSMSFIGKMKGLRRNRITTATITPQPEPPQVVLPSSTTNDDDVEYDSDDDSPKPALRDDDSAKPASRDDDSAQPRDTSPPRPTTQPTSNRVPASPEVVEKASNGNDVDMTQSQSDEQDSSNVVEPDAETTGETQLESATPAARIVGPSLPAHMKPGSDAATGQVDNKEEEGGGKAEEESGSRRKRRRRLHNKKDNMKSGKKTETLSSDPTFATWIPPEDQSGDGKTSLNDKFGY